MTMEIKKFNRHECMDENTMDSIQNAISGLYAIDGVSRMGVKNMLYGLYDGFNYADAIMAHTDMQKVEEQDQLLYSLIADICETVKGYPTGETTLF